jgi:hypothetical protein
MWPQWLGKKVKNQNNMNQAELELIILQLPLSDGSVQEGSLWEFYQSINNGETNLSDDGYTLSDGSLVPTNGQPYVGVEPEDLYNQMSAYIVEDGNIIVEDSPIEPASKMDNDSLMKLALLGLIIYVIVKK